MITAVKRYKADIGIAFDGDGDRVILCDEHGNSIDGDYILAMNAVAMKKEGRLKGDGVVATVMSNIGLELALKKEGIKLVRAKVGDRYVLENMLKQGYILGGEQSGHVIFGEYTTTGDGMITALQVLSLMVVSGKKLSELTRIMDKYPQTIVNVNVSKKIPFSSVPEIEKVIQSVSNKLKDTGRVLVRYSGTEPLARVMIEGQDQKLIQTYAADIAEAIKNTIGAEG
jgi:phosphoglucosamine mutase